MPLWSDSRRGNAHKAMHRLLHNAMHQHKAMHRLDSLGGRPYVSVHYRPTGRSRQAAETAAQLSRVVCRCSRLVKASSIREGLWTLS